MLHSSAQLFAVENPVLSARYQVCLQYAAQAFADVQHEPTCGFVACHAGFELDVRRSTSHRGTDGISLRFLLSGTGLSFSCILSIL